MATTGTAFSFPGRRTVVHLPCAAAAALVLALTVILTVQLRADGVRAAIETTRPLEERLLHRFRVGRLPPGRLPAAVDRTGLDLACRRRSGRPRAGCHPPGRGGTGRRTGTRSDAKAAPGRWILLTSVPGSSMALLDSTVVNVALPHIGDDFGAVLGQLQWTANAYLLTPAAFVLLGGAPSDRFGRRKVFVTGIAWFAAASLLCGLAPRTRKSSSPPARSRA